MSAAVKVIALPGRALPDREMRLWNPRDKGFEDRDWDREDRRFERVHGTMDELAGRFDRTREHIIPAHTPISDQGSRGTCSANAWMDALEILMGLEGPTRVVQLSRLFVYWTGRVLTGLEDEDSGVYLRAVAHQLRKIGVVEESYMPYEDKLEAVLTPPRLSLYTMASNHRINSFYRIKSAGKRMLDDIELAVRANHPVVSSAQVSDEFVNYTGGGHVFSAPSESAGAHAMLIIGVRTVGGRRQFLRRNSWSHLWGDGGHAWCDEDYVAMDEDVWVGTRLNRLV